MARLRVKKHFSLAFLGKDWENGYINFQAFTANDLKGNAGISIDPKNLDAKKVQDGFDSMISLLKERFIDGKMPTEEGKLEDLKKDEIGTLDIDIIQGAISFLSQSETPTLPKPLEESLPQNTA